MVNRFRSPLLIFFLPVDSESFADLVYLLVDKQWTDWHLLREVTLFDVSGGILVLMVAIWVIFEDLDPCVLLITDVAYEVP